MFIKQFDIVRFRSVCLISIVLTKSFNLMPMSKKSTVFFQSVRIFRTVFVRIFEKVIGNHTQSRQTRFPSLLYNCLLSRVMLSALVAGSFEKYFGKFQKILSKNIQRFFFQKICAVLQKISKIIPENFEKYFRKFKNYNILRNNFMTH